MTSPRQVLVTGASSDIGLAVCRKYLENDYKVVGHYHRGQRAFFQLLETSSNMTSIQVDFSNPENLERSIAGNADLFSQSDVVVNAASLVENQPFEDITAANILRAISINLIPGMLLMRTIAPAMVTRGWGRFVHLSSIGVKFGGGSSTFCYSLSKHAMEFLPSCTKDWAAHNVFVNVIRVGITDTRLHAFIPNKDMTKRVSLIPIKRMAQPEEMAKYIFWCGSEKNTFMSRQIIEVAGGE
jgi:NAD(P)-dependent dehydrogenase (short-subunit alcohol dehydrogenase family)